MAIYGAGQAGGAVAELLAERPGLAVEGPFGRSERERALSAGADVVVIATTSFLREIAGDVRTAVGAGSNVLTTAEEAAYPWANDPALADELDELARARGVSILGAGLNPGLAFDALVLTVCGAVPAVESLRVERVVDLGRFGAAVLRRIGVGHEPEAFDAGVRSGEITGHIGFAQSMRLVAARLGVAIERIDREIEPLLAGRDLPLRHLEVRGGQSAGFEQRYTAIAGGRPWFVAHFTGHVAPAEAGLETRDEIHLSGPVPVDLAVAAGFDAQAGSSSVIANSIRRVAGAPPGWRTVADLPPAAPGDGSWNRFW